MQDLPKKYIIRDIKILEKFCKTSDIEYLHYLTHPTVEYMYQKSLTMNTGKSKLVMNYYNKTTRSVCIKVKNLRSKGFNSLKEWLANENNVYTGRRGRIFIDKQIFHYPQSKWHNPFTIKDVPDIKENLRRYKEYLLSSELIYDIEELRGKNLGCFCENEGDDYVCHTHVLLELLNESFNLTKRILVCGSRDYDNYPKIYNTLKSYMTLSSLDSMYKVVVIEGECKGADLLAKKAALKLGYDVLAYPAEWDKYGKAAGPIRNAQMLTEGKPDLVLVFHPNISKSKGTLNMINLTKKAGIKYEILT